MKARRYLISGIVQGVGYRWFAIRAARREGVTGWIRNLPDGRVEVWAEGSEEALSSLRAELTRGPHSASVRRVEELEVSAEGRFTDFDARF